ncbi:methionine biosynthesis protein MetW [Saccharibacter floricola]|nr:methionine biosynthesis protein MetW [Saccharibacter floricola]
MRVDQQVIADMIAPCSRVLDVGSGDGSLIGHLFRTRACDAQGIELSMEAVTHSVAHGLPVIQGDADHDLIHYPNDSFDYVVLQRTLQAVERPREVLRQMLRIGEHAIVSFPNFGHWRLRLQLLYTGRMPMTSVWATPWHETPNIHPCTIKDFFALCEEDGYVVEHWTTVNERGRRAPWYYSPRLANLCGEQALFLLRRKI